MFESDEVKTQLDSWPSWSGSVYSTLLRQIVIVVVKRSAKRIAADCSPVCERLSLSSDLAGSQKLAVLGNHLASR